jgi:hypothetical protein
MMGYYGFLDRAPLGRDEGDPAPNADTPPRRVPRRERGRWCLSAADDHHQDLVGADQRDRWPRRHSRAYKAMAQAAGDVCGQRRDNANPISHRASAGTPAPSCVESSITIELA